MSFSAPGSPPATTPAPPPYSGPPPRVDVLRSPQGLATAVTVLLCVAGAVNLLSAGANAFVFSVMDDLVADPGKVADHTVGLSDGFTALAGSFRLLSMLATAVVFLVWFHRVRVNGEVFRADAFTQKRGWAVGGWFIPIGHLFLPLWTARQIWTASTQHGPDGSLRPVSRAPLTAWWVVWVVASITDRAYSRIYLHAESPEALQATAAFGIGSDLLMVTAAVLAVRFVRRLTAMQHTMALQGPYATA
ncbi:DUF4328 domain-containing protein [Streptomyces sp. MB09-01]|uniref:DUF4328 domain-containing protein n=1 Tax=Streptomyces sp. MB09-01 TaxID=3028666 RepID=UPI0029BC27EB|nr:DUF4328 domain-containing protein [Streptomyces sp. MB09-01]MDX3539424.1 DUF4328 domain-containing protein [Streptomyces sp. MB09-01]